MNLTALLAVTLSALEVLSPAAGSIPAAPTPVAPLAGANESIEVAVPAQFASVVSPWGFIDTYYVYPGWNTLVCSGTGRLFRYFHNGFSVDAEQGAVAE
jgi:hypothetical protein